MKADRRARLEADFLKICQLRGPDWVASVIRPLRLSGEIITPRDIPQGALALIVRIFKRARRPVPGVKVI